MPEFLPVPAGFRMSDERKRLADFEALLHPFEVWSCAGYKILKGSKSVGRDSEGRCLFSGAQVEKYEPYDPSLADEDDPFFEFDPDLPGNPDDYGHSD